ncbi:TPA: hypothetical protein NI671_004967 [Pseudomonas aeruginosa]|uniref:hypothetical protein n=1 Tax=Pseudomonas aeruginosa TaxID=287 RepID=UPI000AAEFDBC|nr:hypothetical protein [Pseudomonas aeruginosa]MBX6699854.1 hypothetical protein [Pseudomonas aeruginosa]MCP9256356.1 hypothetical protein [Pseudomonas aeruginosa]MCW8029618.1 hypothetical protein [Pseudomonas aeruginosa]WMX11488.1 hypothetical protein RG643_32970 [Pseudomonas aeruginosa]HCF4367717.1 hypothetical protein [Pseudomonas aeruginosa]
MNAALSPLTDHMIFSRFEIERCIRVVYEDEETLLPIDGRQNEKHLRLVADHDELLLEHPSLHLLESATIRGPLALLAHEESDEHVAALYNEDDSIAYSTGEYGGVRWRVLGFTKNCDAPTIMASGNCEASIGRIASSLQALLPSVGEKDKAIVHQTYVATTKGGEIEYGYTFKGAPDSEDSLFDLVLGVVPADKRESIQTEFQRHEWAARAISRAAESALG